MTCVNVASCWLHTDVLVRNNLCICGFCTGAIPTSITALSALTSLILSDNSLAASLPTGLSRLWTLHYLDVSNNGVIGVPDDLPTTLR